jgi:hypothetical protein
MLDVLGDMVFSKSFNTMETPEQRWIRDAINDKGRINYTISFPLGYSTPVLPNGPLRI